MEVVFYIWEKKEIFLFLPTWINICSIIFGKFLYKYLLFLQRIAWLWEPLLRKEMAPTLEICLRLPGRGGGVVAALKVISCPITSMDEYSYSCEGTHPLTRNENLHRDRRRSIFAHVVNNICPATMFILTCILFTLVLLYMSNFYLDDEFRPLKAHMSRSINSRQNLEWWVSIYSFMSRVFRMCVQSRFSRSIIQCITRHMIL